MRRVHSLMALLAIAALSSTPAAADAQHAGVAKHQAAKHPVATHHAAKKLAAAHHAAHQASKKLAWQDCKAHGGNRLAGHYTVAELNHALRTMPSYVEEYSNCYGVIQAQILKQQLVHAKVHAKAHDASNNSGSSSTALIVAIAVVAVGGIGLAVWASRRRRRGGPPPTDEPPAA